MHRAIFKNRLQFVELLLESNFNIKKFLTYKRLLKLYNQVSEGSFLRKLYKKEAKLDLDTKNQTDKHNMFHHHVQYDDVGCVIQSLMKNLFLHKFRQTPFNEIQVH
jgi:hypothetical protein